MFQVKNLTITHKTDMTVLADKLSFTLTAGDRAAIIGEEGNGKSTVLKLLYKRELIEDYAEWNGEIIDKGLRKAYLAQELSKEQLEQSIYEFCLSDPHFSAAEPRQLSRAARLVGLDQDIIYDSRSMSTLSGGERVKLRLALLLLAEPDILLLDEPSNDLDIETMEWLESFILSCTIPVLFISHDEALLTASANMIIHLERLRRRSTARVTVIRSGYLEYIQRRQTSLTHQAQIARKEKAEYDEKMDKYRQIRSKVEHQQTTISRQDPHGGQLLKKKMHAVQAMRRRFEREKENMTQMPEWEEAILTFFDKERAFLPAGKAVLRCDMDALYADTRLLSRNIHLWVTGPEKIGIIGANGVGKSTLLKHLAQQLLPRKDLRASYMPQNYADSLLAEKTPVEILAPSGYWDEITRARNLLGAMKYKTEEMEHPSGELSGGQRAKLLFLSMVLKGSNVLVLDEPTRNFSPMSAPVIRGVLADFPGCILSVSHDRQYLRQVCTRILELSESGLHETTV